MCEIFAMVLKYNIFTHEYIMLHKLIENSNSLLVSIGDDFHL